MTIERATCVATNRAGNRCGRYPAPGAAVCSKHGGKAPAVAAAAARRATEQEVVRQAQRLTDAPEPMTLRDVYVELLRTAAVVVAWRNRLTERLNTADLTDETGAATGEVQLFERALDRAAKVCELVARLDLDARLQAMNERDGRQLFEVVEAAALHRADLTGDQWLRLRQGIAAEIRARGGQ